MTGEASLSGHLLKVICLLSAVVLKGIFLSLNWLLATINFTLAPIVFGTLTAIIILSLALLAP